MAARADVPSSAFDGARRNNSGIRYSNIVPLHDASAAPSGVDTAARDSFAQWRIGAPPSAIAT